VSGVLRTFLERGENTGIKKLERKISLNRQNGNVEICDTVQLQ
jgi:hypothetical protein